MKQFEKKYQLWTLVDEPLTNKNTPKTTYTFAEYDRLEDCMAAPHSSEAFITKRVLLNVTDADEQLSAITTVPIYDSVLPTQTPVSDEESPILDKYLGGANGTVTFS